MAERGARPLDGGLGGLFVEAVPGSWRGPGPGRVASPDLGREQSSMNHEPRTTDH